MPRNGIVPPSRPQKPRAEVEQILATHQISNLNVALVGIRGYYRDSMGVPGENDRGIYDDAIFVVSPNVYSTFNANTDPTIYRPKVAKLKEGVWYYKKGPHPARGGYPALRQARPVTVIRDAAVAGGTPYEDTDRPRNFFWINIHRGSYTTTSSLGCQTLFPAQWDAFINTVYSEMARMRYPLTEIPYVLVEQQG